MFFIGKEGKFQLTFGSNWKAPNASRGFFSFGFKKEEKNLGVRYMGFDFYLFYIDLTWPYFIEN